MAKRRSSKPTAGQRVRVNDGVSMPEYPELDISGWTGVVMETQGRGATAKVILNWSDEALESMSNEYREMCDSQNMLYSMACLLMSDVTIDE
ncbi:hypothetical protein KOR42_29000 [Thalassoglobus neptunius]|uniref:Uncharacterized protein n=1 Tax=Thalassoglobus neptunius TaxID=1938619 RepID=A0A5C5WZF4_9PLAN|nr:hypothetical protein [Thalassoglobus neptunius]TWT55273.1 hypothetical protein KOR42_29000 [Thalassoglobus neptunius]